MPARTSLLTLHPSLRQLARSTSLLQLHPGAALEQHQETPHARARISTRVLSPQRCSEAAMGPGKKLRAWRERRRAQQHPSPVSQPSASSSLYASVSPSPASAQASTRRLAPSPAAASGSSSEPRSRSEPIQRPPALASTIFPFMRVIEHPESSEKVFPPRLVYVSVSSDLRLIYADSQSNKPTSLVDFRGADLCLSLTRMAYEPPKASAPPPSLDDFVAPRVRPETHPTGPAVRIVHKKRIILLIAPTDEERDALLSALRLRLAPWPILRQRMEAEMRAAAAPSASAPSLADAARELLSCAGGASGASAGSASDAGGKGAAGAARIVWEKAGTVAQMSLWAATFGQGLGGVVRTAEELEKLSKPLGGLAVVGCAFSLVALSARAVSLMGMEREGRDRLAHARKDLREASVSIVGWLFSILGSGFRDEDGLVGKVFDVLGECWDGADELEQYLLHHWAILAWRAEDIGVIVGKVESVAGKLLSTGLLNVVAKHERRIVKHDHRIGGLEEKAFVADEFHSYAPPVSFDFGLVSNAATSLAQLKAAVLPTGCAEGSTGADDFNGSGSSSNLRRVALTSVNGEGGVGKTSTCKLLCVDEEVRAYFSDGAILWINVGKDATDEEVKGELVSAVLMCGGGHSAELISSSRDIRAAVGIARLFFSKRRVLVVADIVWETPSGSSVLGWAASLSSIVSFPGSAVIITTRFISLSRIPGFGRVKLGRLDLSTEESPDWGVAEDLYDALLSEEAKVQSSEVYKKSRRRALVHSCGLPLGIATFAGLVQSYCEIGDDVETVLSSIEQRALGLGDKVVGEDLKASTGHPGLFAAMEESLSYLDQRERIDCRVKPKPLSVREDVHGNDIRAFSSSYDAFSGQSLSARYTALDMMLPSSPSISFPLLCRLWHVPSIADAKSIALVFVNVGLGKIEGGEEKLFTLHDLQYAFCASPCERSSSPSPGATIDDVRPSLGTVNGHALFLSSCESLLGSEIVEDNSDVGWATFRFGDEPVLPEPLLRHYLAQNFFRYLCGAASGVRQDSADFVGVRRTIVNVLSDFCWLRGRFARDGRASAVRDFWYAISSRGSTTSGDDAMLLDSDMNNSIRAVRDCLLLLPDDVRMKSDGTLAGYLVQVAQSCVERGDAGRDAYLLNRLTSSVVNQVRGAWVKPIFGCSRARRDQVVLAQAVVGSGAAVRSLAALGDGAHFVSGSSDGVVRVHDGVELQAVLELKGHTSRASWAIRCVDVAKNGDVEGSILLFCGSDGGIVRSWEVSLDPVEGVVEEASAVVGYCERSVEDLAVSKGGDLIAAGCKNGVVFIWKRRGGDATFDFELVSSFRCSVDEEESGLVRGVHSAMTVAVSRSGCLVVAGEEMGAVAFWSSAGSGMEGHVDRHCASGESGTDLRLVFFSEDESSVTFVFNGPVAGCVGCEVWDVASRRRRLPRVALSDSSHLRYHRCATFSGDEDACAEVSGTRGVLVGGKTLMGQVLFWSF